LPFVPLSPSLLLMEKIVFALREIRADRAHLGLKALVENIAALEAPDRAGFTPEIGEATLAHMLAGVGILEASLGHEIAWERARLVEAHADHRVNAWRIRYMIHLYKPNAQKADECRREIELLRLQEGPRQFGEGSTLETELLAFARNDDLLGIARVRSQLEERSVRYSGWIPWTFIAEAEFERMRHRLDRSIELHERALALTAPGRHSAWTHGTAFLLEVLVLAGRAEEAKRRGEAGTLEAEKHGLETGGLIWLGLALAEAALGNHAAARTRIAEAFEVSQRRPAFGIYEGLHHEVAARVAVDCDDAPAFMHHYTRCWEQYGSGAYPPLTARLEKLMTAARRKKLAGTTRRGNSLAVVSVERVRDEMAAAKTKDARAKCALALLLEAAHAQAGHLYGIRDADIEWLASVAAPMPGAELEDMLRSMLREQSDEERTLGVEELSRRPTKVHTYAKSDTAVLHYLPVLLTRGIGAGASVVAIAALACDLKNAVRVTTELASVIGDELVAAADVSGLTLM
jgi:hypothetical protein